MLVKSFEQVKFYFIIKKLGVSPNQPLLSHVVFRKWSMGNN